MRVSKKPRVNFWRRLLQFHIAEASLFHPWGLLAALIRSPSRLLDGVTASHHRFLDRAAASVTQNPMLFPNGFFSDGWGDLNTPTRILELVQSRRMSDVVELQEEHLMWDSVQKLSVAKVALRVGKFQSTLDNAQQLLPKASLDAFCELVTPLEWEGQAKGIPQGRLDRPLEPVSTGFCIEGRPLLSPWQSKGLQPWCETFSKILALLKNVLTVVQILEGPFYGQRKPPQQKGSKLRRVSDLTILGQATIEEAKSLLAHFRDIYNFSQLVVAGSSMGGLHAAMVASVFSGDVGAIAWLAPPSAAPVFADGLLSGSCNWPSLYKQHELQLLDHKMLAGHALVESYKKLVSPVTDGFKEKIDFLNGTLDPVNEAKKRLRLFLSITDIENFLPPRRPDAVIFVYGTEDEYIGFSEPQWQRLREQWRPAQFRKIKRGHVSGILLEQEEYRKTVLEVVELLKEQPIFMP